MLKRLINWIWSWIVSAPKAEIPKEVYIAGNVKLGTEDMTTSHVALIVGHNEKEQGAANYHGETEFSFNSRIAQKVSDRLAKRAVMCAIIKRPHGRSYSSQVDSVIKELKKVRAPFAISLHFNAHTKRVYGCEALIDESVIYNDSTWLLADYFTDELNRKMRLVERHQDGLKVIKKNHNGALMLRELRDIGVSAFIAEPVFANIKTPESEMFFDSEELYVEILASTLYRAHKKRLS